MKKFILISLLVNGLAFSMPVFANQAASQLGTCMIDSLTGKERKKLAIWIFFGMTAHPEIMPYSNVTDENRTQLDQDTGALITRLLTEDCPAQTKEVMGEANSLAMQSAFELVGRVAMQELMTNQEVARAMASFEQYMDKNKINALAVQGAN